MAKQVTEYQTTQRGNESGAGSNNNLYQQDFQNSVSNDNYSNGMGIARPSALKPMEDIPGLEQSDQYMLKMREVSRYNELSSKAFGNPTINNAGIVLDTFGGAFGEAQKSPMKPDIQGGASK